uniref:T9SS type A sorting domain-containing protein n=1 Tax=Eiseniibacteriota bacterium TaxID=2212470 RepID=A0A832IAU1_UNCEI
MRSNTSAGYRSARAAALLGVALLLSAPAAHAQLNPIIFDGNLLWNNGTGGTSHYAGTASAGSPCLPGLDSTTTQIATLQFTNNLSLDPLLSGALNALTPNWRPDLGSPAFCGNGGRVVNVPNNGFFQQVSWIGALGPSEPDWTQGWTYYGLDGGGRTFPVRPLVILDNQNLYSNRTLSADSNYLVRGQLRVKAQARLTIPAGTYLFEEAATVGAIVIERGAFIDAQGTPTNPIVITSDAAPGEQTPGGGGGLYVNGYAKINQVNSCAGDSAVTEGLLTSYGGNDDADSSGVLRYVRVEFAGVVVSPNNEANSFTFNGVGSRTVAEYLQAHRGLDDLFEWFGGTARARYLVGTYGDDDGLDWQMGYRGNVQFAIIRQLALQAGADAGIEADNNEFANDTEICSGRSNPTFANLTLIGDRTTGTGFSGVRRGAILRRGTGGQILNSIITEWKTTGLEINGSATFNNHCADRAAAVSPGVYCPGAVSAPLARGSVFVAHSAPNPFRSDVAIRFALPQGGRAQVDIFSADGRLVRSLADGDFAPGEHVIRWTPDRATPAGVYFYLVRAAGERATGKIVRVD